jgi:hypothetical protein
MSWDSVVDYRCSLYQESLGALWLPSYNSEFADVLNGCFK